MCTTEVHEVRGGGVGSAATVAAPVARVVGGPPMTGWTCVAPGGLRVRRGAGAGAGAW